VWLRISDGEATLFSGSLGAGQTYQLPATAQHPMLRTGRPQLLRATIGNDDIGPLEATEHTVDNFSLLPRDLAARPRVQAVVAPPPAAAPARPPATAPPPAPQPAPQQTPLSVPPPQ
jgi:hypothetical protein